MVILINKIIKATNAISQSDGLELYDFLKSLPKGKDYVLSFEGINRVSTAFLNACIGKLIIDGEYKPSQIDRKTASNIVLTKLDRVSENAKIYPRYNEIVKDATAMC